MFRGFFNAFCNPIHTELSLLIRAGDFWFVWKELGIESGALMAKVESEVDQPPVKGWQYWDGSKYELDTSLVCSREVSKPCSEVRVELQGEAKKKYPKFSGSYKPVKGKMNRGRWVGSCSYQSTLICKT